MHFVDGRPPGPEGIFNVVGAVDAAFVQRASVNALMVRVPRLSSVVSRPPPGTNVAFFQTVAVSEMHVSRMMALTADGPLEHVVSL